MTFCLRFEGWTWMVLLNFGYGEGSDSSHSQTWRIKRTQFLNPKYLRRKYKNVIFCLVLKDNFENENVNQYLMRKVANVISKWLQLFVYCGISGVVCQGSLFSVISGETSLEKLLFLADFIKKLDPFYKKIFFDNLYRPKSQKVRK